MVHTHLCFWLLVQMDMAQMVQMNNANNAEINNMFAKSMCGFLDKVGDMMASCTAVISTKVVCNFCSPLMYVRWYIDTLMIPLFLILIMLPTMMVVCSQKEIQPSSGNVKRERGATKPTSSSYKKKHSVVVMVNGEEIVVSAGFVV